MIKGLIILGTLGLLATVISSELKVPIPGAILGLLALVAICTVRGKTGASLDRASQLLTLLIPLLIMPSCIGIMDHWHLLKKEWLAIMVAISGSVILTLVTTPWLTRKLQNQTNKEAL